MSEFHVINWEKWNFEVVFNLPCCHGNNKSVKFYLSIKIFHQHNYFSHLPSLTLSAVTTFLLPGFGQWHILTQPKSCLATFRGTFFPLLLWYLLLLWISNVLLGNSSMAPVFSCNQINEQPENLYNMYIVVIIESVLATSLSF